MKSWRVRAGVFVVVGIFVAVVLKRSRGTTDPTRPLSQVSGTSIRKSAEPMHRKGRMHVTTATHATSSGSPTVAQTATDAAGELNIEREDARLPASGTTSRNPVGLRHPGSTADLQRQMLVRSPPDPNRAAASDWRTLKGNRSERNMWRFVATQPYRKKTTAAK
jgi:hypothetical protein